MRGSDLGLRCMLHLSVAVQCFFGLGFNLRHIRYLRSNNKVTMGKGRNGKRWQKCGALTGPERKPQAEPVRDDLRGTRRSGGRKEKEDMYRLQ